MSAAKREPVRTCVGCRRRAEKAALLRVVLGPDGLFAADPTGRAPGRGAYVHPEAGCIDAAVRRGALARALRTGPQTGEAARLLEAVRSAASSDAPSGSTDDEGTGSA
ncbi:MAG TPA: YlxR family protein [Actinomycetota bacterium]|nr:YlxR family protein [Actinomycetota bacterium]